MIHVERIQRWNANAVDPNRSFYPGTPAEECAALLKLLQSYTIDNVPHKFTLHIDLHETTDTGMYVYTRLHLSVFLSVCPCIIPLI